MKSTIILLTVSSVALVVVCGIGRFKKKDIIVETIRDVIVVFVSAFLALAITYYQEEKDTKDKIQNIISVIADKEYDDLVSKGICEKEIEEEIEEREVISYIDSWVYNIENDDDDLIQNIFKSELILSNIDFKIYSKILQKNDLILSYKEKIYEEYNKENIDYIQLLDYIQLYYQEKMNFVVFLDAYRTKTDIDLSSEEDRTEIESMNIRNYSSYVHTMSENINHIKLFIDPAATFWMQEVDPLDGIPRGVIGHRVGPAEDNETEKEEIEEK